MRVVNFDFCPLRGYFDCKFVMSSFRFILPLVILLLLIPLGLLSCYKNQIKGGKAAIESTSLGIRIVATYDSRFDRLFTDYNLLSITLINQSPNLLELDPHEDAWTITTKDGMEAKAINNLRFIDRRAWESLSPRAQEIVEYPRIILRNTTITFDLFFPEAVDLSDFRRIDFYSKSLAQRFVGGGTYSDIP